MLDLAVYLIGAVLAAVGVSRALGLFVVRGTSMLPTLQEGDWVLARRLLPRERPRAGAVVTCLRGGPRPVVIKRVLAGPGEVLPAEISVSESRLPETRYLLAGDNAQGGRAPGWLGPVEREQLWGVAWAVVWPWRRLRRVR